MFLFGIVFILVASILFTNNLSGRETPPSFPGHPVVLEVPQVKEIVGFVRYGESLFDIFKRHGLDLNYLDRIVSSSRRVYNLFRMLPGRSYIISTFVYPDGNRELSSFKYAIDDTRFLQVVNLGDTFKARKVEVEYERRPALIMGKIEDNLINAVGDTREHLKVAYELAEIFESEIDFVTELRKGDSFTVLVEELWHDNAFKGYGEILAAEFVNNGRRFEAYRYELDGRAYYFDSKGRSLKKALMRAPLRFRYISSRFSYRRKHPILKIFRPHLGVDYAAPTGTPVSAAGNGTVKYAGWKGHYGKCVIIRHPNGYVTYYGHLSRIRRGIRRGVKVVQGQIIGYVGMTGRATGPHLDYRVKKNGRFINPLSMRVPRDRPVPKKYMADFKRYIKKTNSLIASLKRQKGSLYAAKSSSKDIKAD